MRPIIDLIFRSAIGYTQMKNHYNPESKPKPSILVTDLDGTLIPLTDNAENTEALLSLNKEHNQNKFKLIFATGRSYNSVIKAIETLHLPTPEWMICDVGTSIYQNIGGRFERLQDYETHLADKVGIDNRASIESSLHTIAQLELQEPGSQQRFKISYQCAGEDLQPLVGQINQLLQTKSWPLACMGSIDPFLDKGLIDILPVGVNKSYAVLWLSAYAHFNADEVIYAGDSGNDYAALIAGFRAILVANASTGLAEQVQQGLKKIEKLDYLFQANKVATSGVLEGCEYFRLFDE